MDHSTHCSTNQKKRLLCALLALLCALALPALPAASVARADGQGPLRIVCTTFPQYDWVRQILGEEAAELTLLSGSADLHSYQPSVRDIAAISACDLFVYVGGPSDAWVPDVLAAAGDPGRATLALLTVAQAKEEELAEGMQAEHEHEHEHEHDADGVEYDEHVWLSLKTAQGLVQAICDALGARRPASREAYQKNADAYIAQLAALDARYQAAVDAAPRQVILFGDRFPFRYLADDYGLTYYAAFLGCSAETEASFATIAFLAGKVDELDLPAILVIEGARHPIAQTVAANTADKDQKILVMNSMQSVTAQDVADGASYLSIMEDNLAVLTEALS